MKEGDIFLMQFLCEYEHLARNLKEMKQQHHTHTPANLFILIYYDPITYIYMFSHSS